MTTLTRTGGASAGGTADWRGRRGRRLSVAVRRNGVVHTSTSMAPRIAEMGPSAQPSSTAVQTPNRCARTAMVAIGLAMKTAVVRSAMGEGGEASPLPPLRRPPIILSLLTVEAADPAFDAPHPHRLSSASG